MKRLLALLILTAATFLAGCGVTYTYRERERRFRHTNDIQARMLIDDFDSFWLYDRPSYLSYWYVREAD